MPLTPSRGRPCVPAGRLVIKNALGIESDDVANYRFLKAWAANASSANIIGEWLQTEARFVSLMTEFGGLVGGADMMPALVPGVKNTSWRIDHLIGAREV